VSWGSKITKVKCFTAQVHGGEILNLVANLTLPDISCQKESFLPEVSEIFNSPFGTKL
jgi:hypothetical protein